MRPAVRKEKPGDVEEIAVGDRESVFGIGFPDEEQGDGVADVEPPSVYPTGCCDTGAIVSSVSGRVTIFAPSHLASCCEISCMKVDPQSLTGRHGVGNR